MPIAKCSSGASLRSIWRPNSQHKLARFTSLSGCNRGSPQIRWLASQAMPQRTPMNRRESTIGLHPDGPLIPFSRLPHQAAASFVTSGDTDAQDLAKRLNIQADGRWLREICSCVECRNQDTAQRNINVFKMDRKSSAIRQVLPATNGQGVEVAFEDGHVSFFPIEAFIGRTAAQTQENRAGFASVKPWSAGIANNPPTVKHVDVKSGSGMGGLMRLIREYGFAFIDQMPATPEASEDLLRSIGPIRDTHYGAFYDFTSDLSSKDTAYTAEALEPHTDNTYFTEPAGLQALHMLSHTGGSGGESSLVDGFAAADQLYRQDPQAYEILSTTGVHAHASGNDGVNIQPSQAIPTFVHDQTLGMLQQVRWNNADRGGVATAFENLKQWYDAAAQFDEILSNVKNQYWFQLQPGKMLLFDNWRVLHGRAAFTGKRRMCGGYINRDDFISKYRTTNLSKNELSSSTVTG
ncbi:Trimethyllysine dioxygenase [Hortaea werneckii]|nr:Trimethyllysine dioxygenase [Hortaea werneckii]